MRVTALKPITPRTISKFENSDLWYLPSLCTSLYDIFINWERTSLAYDKVQMTKARLTLSPGSRVMLVPIPLVMRGVPAQIFFAVPGDKTWPAETVWDLVQLTLDHPLQVELELDLLAGRGQMEQEAKCCQRPKRPHQNPIIVLSYVRFSSRLTFWENLSSKSLPAITEVCSKYLAPVPWQSPSCVTLLTIDPLKHIWMFDAIADLLCQPMFLEISKCEKSHLGNQFSILNRMLSILKTTFHHPSQLSRFALKYKLYSD